MNRRDRPRRRWWPWFLLGLSCPLVLAVGAVIGYQMFMQVAVRLMLQDQPAQVLLPPTAEARLSVSNAIDIHLKGRIDAQVPLVQTLSLPIEGHYDTLIDLDTHVPLRTTIRYEGILPIDTLAEIEAMAPINFQNVKTYKNMRFKAKLPMKMRLPVKLEVPVDEEVRIRYRGPLKVSLQHTLQVPVDSQLNTALDVDQIFSVPVSSTLPLEMRMPASPVQATIVSSDLYLDLATLRLEQKTEPQDATP